MSGSGSRLSIGRLDSPWFRRCAAGLPLLLFAGYGIAYLWVFLTGASDHSFSDSFAVWSWAHIAENSSAALLYDAAGLHAAQVALGMNPGAYYLFGYPPSYLLVLWPIGLLPYAIGSAVLLAVTLILYLCATLGRGWRWPVLAAALALPSTTIAIISGQTGFLAAALLAGGLRLGARRPILSGILFGLLTYKPQLGLLVPVALVSARWWRTLGVAVATALALVLVTSLLFGGRIWFEWLAAAPVYSRQFAAESGEILHLMPTVFASLVRLGVAPEWAWLGQGTAGLAAAIAVWTAFRAGASEPAKALLLAATFLATPYAFVYDLPMLAPAIIWLVVDRQRSGEGFAPAEILILELAALFPITMPGGSSRLPLASLVLTAFVAMIMLDLRRRQRPPTAVSPVALASLR